MIAGCIDRMERHSCAGCERNDPCQDWLLDFGLGPDWAARNTPGSALKAFFGEVAKAFQGAVRSEPSALERKIEALIEPLLGTGPVRIEDIARSLGYGRQTLYRRLKAEGVTFEQILDRLRRRLAARFLDDGLSVKETAYRLGFSDPAAFSRAFKRWSGINPSEVQRRSN